MISKVINSSAIFFVSSILTRGLGLLLLPIFTQYLSAEDYGLFELIFITSTVLCMLLPLEISQSVARFYTEKNAGNSIFSTGVFFTIIGYVGFSLLFQTIVHWFKLEHFFTPFFYENILIINGLFLSYGIFYILQNQFKWRLEPHLYALTSVAYSLLVLALSYYYLVVAVIGLKGVLLAYMISGFCCSIFCVYKLRKELFVLPSLVVFKKLLAFSIPLVPASLSIWLMQSLDRVMLSSLNGLVEVGTFSIAAKFANIGLLAITAIQSALTPLIYKHHTEHDTPDKIASILSIYLTMCLIIILGAFLFSDNLVDIFVSGDFGQVAIVICVLVPAILFNGLYIFFPGLYIFKKTKSIMWLSIFSTILNVIFNGLLIPSYGAIGAAIATLLSSSMYVALIYHFSSKLYPCPYKFRGFISWLVAMLLLIILFTFFDGLIMPFVTKVMIFILLFSVIVYTRHQFELKTIIKKKEA